MNAFVLESHVRQFVSQRKIGIWGAGRLLPEVLKALEYNHITPAFFVDRNESLAGKIGIPFLHKKELVKTKYYIIISTLDYCSDIKKELNELGFMPGHDYLNWFEEAGRYPYRYNLYDCTIGKHTFFPGGVYHLAKDGIITSIGSFTAIAPAAQISFNHRMDMIATSLPSCLIPDENDVKHPNLDVPTLRIGNDVWIGANSFINCSRCHSIGNGAIIGAGSVVQHDVPDYAVVYGSPARVQRFRFSPAQIEILQLVKWWDWTDEKISENSELFFDTNQFFETYSCDYMAGMAK